MPLWAYRKSDSVFLEGGQFEPTVDGTVSGLVALTRNPDRVLERYDGAGGIRPATAQEISDDDAAQKTLRTATEFDNQKLVKAVAIWTAQKLGIPLQTARQEILTILRTL